MGQPTVENETPFAFAPLFLANEEGQPLFVAVVKGTWAISKDGRSLALAEEQVEVNLSGERWGKPEESSYRYEPECAFAKPGTDVALVGSASAPSVGTTEMLVAFQVGALKKGVRVVGDRGFYKAAGSIGMTRPVAFERIPLTWERAFGGRDGDEFEPRNPVGTGFRGSGGFEDGLRAPNLEDPARPMKGWGDRPPPAGFGFTSPEWAPRMQFAGTYDAQWEKTRAPLLPSDFDRRFFNAAAPGLCFDGFLRGDEQVVASGTTPEGGVAFRLPGVQVPKVKVTRNAQPDAELAMALDTVIVDTDAWRVFLLWRGSVALRDPTGVETVHIS